MARLATACARHIVARWNDEFAGTWRSSHHAHRHCSGSSGSAQAGRL